jgi:hypothetical protein
LTVKEIIRRIQTFIHPRQELRPVMFIWIEGIFILVLPMSFLKTSLLGQSSVKNGMNSYSLDEIHDRIEAFWTNLVG